MRWLVMMLAIGLIDMPAWSAETAQRGQEVFNRTCANALCHAREGGDGSSAPRLADRDFDDTFISNTVRHGKQETAMPAFETVLPKDDLLAVIAYVAKLNGLNASSMSRQESAPVAPQPTLSAKAAQGRILFGDATRGPGACSTCHRLQGQGIAVSSAIQVVPPNVQALRQLATPHVVTVTLDGEAMPAIMVKDGKSASIFYDLTTAPPVLNTRDPAHVTVQHCGSWVHAQYIHAYSAEELGAGLEYLLAVVPAETKAATNQ